MDSHGRDAAVPSIGVSSEENNEEVPFVDPFGGQWSGFSLPAVQDVWSEQRLTPRHSIAGSTDHESESGESHDPSADDLEVEAGGEEATVDKNLLTFSGPVTANVLFDQQLQSVSMLVSAQLSGLFFSQSSNAGDLPSPTERRRALYCYRRNLFTVSGSVALPRGFKYVVTSPTTSPAPAIGYELVISARETVANAPTRMVQVPLKGPGGHIPAAELNNDAGPRPIVLDEAHALGTDPEYTVHSFEWKRLQFRRATLNNGRRRELQQYFVISVTLYARLLDGQSIPVCQSSSSAIIVRGRSPLNFARSLGRSRSDTARRPESTRLERSRTRVDDVDHRQQSQYLIPTQQYPRMPSHDAQPAMMYYTSQNYQMSTGDQLSVPTLHSSRSHSGHTYAESPSSHWLERYTTSSELLQPSPYSVQHASPVLDQSFHGNTLGRLPGTRSASLGGSFHTAEAMSPPTGPFNSPRQPPPLATSAPYSQHGDVIEEGEDDLETPIARSRPPHAQHGGMIEDGEDDLQTPIARTRPSLDAQSQLALQPLNLVLDLDYPDLASFAL